MLSLVHELWTSERQDGGDPLPYTPTDLRTSDGGPINTRKKAWRVIAEFVRQCEHVEDPK